jgi:hypothetical protein
MNLIELLARELKEWPEGWVAAAQESNAKIAGFRTVPLVFNDLQGWDSPDETSYIGLSRDVVNVSQLANDWNISYVTREQWEAVVSIPPATTTSTLETMLTEWRDLEARAQAAQAEADALFEHAGQCHGEIVVRLAELGWGAPRVAAVVSEPVCRPPLADDWYKHVKVGDMLTYRVGDGKYHMRDEFTSGQSYRVHSLDSDNETSLPWTLWSNGDVYFWGSPDYFIPSAQQ